MHHANSIKIEQDPYSDVLCGIGRTRISFIILTGEVLMQGPQQLWELRA
jgi:hypothetical protein